jgi:hypothetical protein
MSTRALHPRNKKEKTDPPFVNSTSVSTWVKETVAIPKIRLHNLPSRTEVGTLCPAAGSGVEVLECQQRMPISIHSVIAARCYDGLSSPD